MKRKALTIALALFLAPVLSFGQMKSDVTKKTDITSALLGAGTQPQGLLGMLGLNPNRFHMSQSYTLSLMTVGGHSLSQGVYLNTMRYDVSDPLTLSVEWGLLHKPLEAAGVSSPFQSGLFLSGAALQFKPSKNFQIGVEYSSYPTNWYQRDYLGLPYRASSLDPQN